MGRAAPFGREQLNGSTIDTQTFSDLPSQTPEQETAMHRRFFLAAGLVIPFVFTAAMPSAKAAERKPFDMASFEAAQQRGARILVDISASWCPTCKAQKPIIDSLAGQPANKDLVIFAVDFDSQKPVVRQFGARSQSTLIAFRGKTETGRSVGDTNPGSIAALVQSNLTR